jgi:hypothetical protein
VNPRRKELHEIHWMRSETDEEHGGIQEVVRLKNSLGLGYI